MGSKLWEIWGEKGGIGNRKVVYYGYTMSQVVIFIDGENFLHKIEEVVARENPKFNLPLAASLNVRKLIESALPEANIDQIKFYAAKLHYNEKTPEKSRQLITAQRKLHNTLTASKIEFVRAGNVRAQTITAGRSTRLLFREKGVDVRLAVDMVAMACDRKIKTAILCSSDSDLQPAVKELGKRGIEVVYLGFELKPNKGLAYTCDRTILFRNSEVMNALSTKLKNKGRKK